LVVVGGVVVMRNNQPPLKTSACSFLMMVGWWWDVSDRVVAGREGQTPPLAFRATEGVVAGREMGKPLRSHFERQREGGGRQREGVVASGERGW
jgi:hypothetical protein